MKTGKMKLLDSFWGSERSYKQRSLLPLGLFGEHADSLLIDQKLNSYFGSTSYLVAAPVL